MKNLFSYTGFNMGSICLANVCMASPNHASEGDLT
jgi:hypothetical protein